MGILILQTNTVKSRVNYSLKFTALFFLLFTIAQITFAVHSNFCQYSHLRCLYDIRPSIHLFAQASKSNHLLKTQRQKKQQYRKTREGEKRIRNVYCSVKSTTVSNVNRVGNCAQTQSRLFLLEDIPETSKTPRRYTKELYLTLLGAFAVGVNYTRKKMLFLRKSNDCLYEKRWFSINSIANYFEP